MTFTKETQIKTLKLLIEDKGDCGRVSCPDCFYALFGVEKGNLSCHNSIYEIMTPKEKVILTRVRLAKKRLAELTNDYTSNYILADEETIILNQNA